MKTRRFLAIMLAIMLLVLCSGCGMEESLVINQDFSSQNTVKYYTTSQEEAEISRELEGTGVTREQLLQESDIVYLGKEEVDGVEYHVYQIIQKMSKADTKDSFAALNRQQAVLGTSDLGEILDESMGEDEHLEGWNPMSVNHMVLNIRYPFQVVRTNGKLQQDGYTVQYSMDEIRNNERLYAVSSEKTANVRTCTISGVKNNGCYRKMKTVKVSSEGVITSFKVNNESQLENKYYASLDGIYKVKVKLLSGSTKTLKFMIDQTKPTTNIKAKSYKNKVKITFQDKTSGVKKAVLDGKTIKNGTVVSQKGQHVLKVTDKAGNVRSVKFSIK